MTRYNYVYPYGNNYCFRFQVCLGVRAECSGFTEKLHETITRGQGQYAFDEQRENFFLDAPTVHSKFPNAERFTTPLDAALECDFWKFVISKRLNLSITKYSFGSLQNFLSAYQLKFNQSPDVRLSDESLWGLELKYFLRSLDTTDLPKQFPSNMHLLRIEWEQEKQIALQTLEKLNSFSAFKLKVLKRYLSDVSEICSCGPMDDGISAAVALLECNLATKIERLRAELNRNLEIMESYKPDAFTGQPLYKQDANPKKV